MNAQLNDLAELKDIRIWTRLLRERIRALDIQRLKGDADVPRDWRPGSITQSLEHILEASDMMAMHVREFPATDVATKEAMNRL